MLVLVARSVLRPRPDESSDLELFGRRLNMFSFFFCVAFRLPRLSRSWEGARVHPPVCVICHCWGGMATYGLMDLMDTLLMGLVEWSARVVDVGGRTDGQDETASYAGVFPVVKAPCRTRRRTHASLRQYKPSWPKHTRRITNYEGRADTFARNLSKTAFFPSSVLPYPPCAFSGRKREMHTG